MKMEEEASDLPGGIKNYNVRYEERGRWYVEKTKMFNKDMQDKQDKGPVLNLNIDD